MPLSEQQIQEFRQKYNLDGVGGGESPRMQRLRQVAGVQQDVIEPPEPSQRNRGREFATGVGKGALSTLLGGASLVRGAAQTLIPKRFESKFGFEDERTSPEFQRKRLATPETGFEKAGFLTEQIAEFLVPSSKIAKVSRGANLLKRSVIEGTTVGTQISIQQGKIDNETKTATLIGAAFPIVGAGLRATKGIFRPLGRKIQTSVIRPTTRDVKDGFDLKNVIDVECVRKI